MRTHSENQAYFQNKSSARANRVSRGREKSEKNRLLVDGDYRNLGVGEIYGRAKRLGLKGAMEVILEDSQNKYVFNKTENLKR